MEWKVRKPNTKSRAKHRWHIWYAWYPVRVPTKGHMSGQTKIWLERIQRKGTYYSYPCSGWIWEYKRI